MKSMDGQGFWIISVLDIESKVNPYENIILISHEDTSKDITKKGGDKITAIKPNMQDKVALKVAGMVDIVARIVADGDDRTFNFKSNEVIFGGGRLKTDAKDIPLDVNELFRVYYDGKKAVPAWVRKKQWIVLQVKGDRAVIDKSVDGENSIESPISTKYLTVVKSTTTTPQKAFEPYLVKINTAALNIRKGAGTNYDVVGCIRDRGVYTIVDESTGSGAKKWGKLKSGAGWISLDYCIKR